jgi:hypothetical protein
MSIVIGPPIDARTRWRLPFPHPITTPTSGPRFALSKRSLTAEASYPATAAAPCFMAFMGDDRIAIQGSYAYDASVRVPLGISLKRYRLIGLEIDNEAETGFFAWIEVESEDCRGDGPRIRYGMLLTPGQASRREYFGFSDPGMEDYPRIRLWSPLHGTGSGNAIGEGGLESETSTHNPAA